MAKVNRTQDYPRIIDEEDKYHGYLDVSKLNQHSIKLDQSVLREIILIAINYADQKSKREVTFEFEGEIEQVQNSFREESYRLFSYFIKYCGEPASTAFDCLGKHYEYVAKNAFRNRIIQMERMNTGWRYQHLAKDAARLSKRFESVSDLNLQEADFVATIARNDINKKLNIYVSVKNRSNTMGGQDWPKAIRALEEMANTDKNRDGAYICVFGIAIDRGERLIKSNSKTKIPYSTNTEVWFSDFFWPFFSNLSYEEISKAVLDVFISEKYHSSLSVEMPKDVITGFGEICADLGLVDNNGIFIDAHKLVELFCGTLKWSKKKTKK